MFTTVAFLRSVDAAAALTNLLPVTDQHVFTSGNDLRVPAANQLVAVAGGVGSGSTGILRIDAPSLLDLTRLYINPVNGRNDGNVEPDTPQAVHDLRGNPIPLAVDEAINAVIQSDTTAAAIQWAILWLADGPVAPVGQGEIITVRATGATALVASAWTLVDPITFADALPVGNYAVVGLRAQSTGLIAARLVFRGGLWRPGVLGVDTENDLQWPGFRSGQMGVFGEFHSTTPPAVECLSVSADGAETFFFDLVKVS